MGKILGQRLRGLREERGGGLKQIAPEIGVSYTYLSKLENGLVEPSLDTIGALADFYDVDPEILSVLAGKLPDDVLDILQKQPERAILLLRKRFGHSD